MNEVEWVRTFAPIRLSIIMLRSGQTGLENFKLISFPYDPCKLYRFRQREKHFAERIFLRD